MLTSIALILLTGMMMGFIFRKAHLPALTGMIFAGIILGTYVLDLLDDSLMNISADIRQAALVIILTRAGLTLSISDLEKSGINAFLMCFVPALAEITGTVIIAPKLFGIGITEALLLGSVIAAVSPAVIVPSMIKIIDEGYGRKHLVPQTILAGASADDIFVIVLFTSFTAFAEGQSVSAGEFAGIPVSIVLGALLGGAVGYGMSIFFRKFHMRDTVKAAVMLGISFLMLELQSQLENTVKISALIGIMAAGIILNNSYPKLAKRLSVKYNKMWVIAEVMLFVLVGASVNINAAADYGIKGVIYVFAVLIFRMMGVLIALIKSPMTMKERIFCMIAYTPKATVQAAIGAVPLSMGLECGQLILTVSVLSILITAPLGAFATELSYKRLLANDK